MPVKDGHHPAEVRACARPFGLTGDGREHQQDAHHHAHHHRGLPVGLGAQQQQPGLVQGAVVGLLRHRQQVAHERVDVHALHAADSMTSPEAGPHRRHEGSSSRMRRSAEHWVMPWSLVTRTLTRPQRPVRTSSEIRRPTLSSTWSAGTLQYLLQHSAHGGVVVRAENVTRPVRFLPVERREHRPLPLVARCGTG
ncbi:hypothetical protein EYF80_041421 [Liparis tanakae]|uniref:Uncharacterized protein n=1 Tax=Liparis tanakae TaxID=230148 RepID=A0A4Z2G678_9TELE|nr:hypothetical protein EYF80_041421 [Liparis tanakae]